MQLTTVLSDSFVAITAIFSFANIFRKNLEVHFLIKIIPFLLMIVAACVGTLRFSLFPDLLITHELLSAVASHIGMIFLAILFYSFFIKPFQYTVPSLMTLIFFSMLSISFSSTTTYTQLVYTKITGTIAVVGIMAVCISQLKKQKIAAVIGIVACVFSIIAGAFQEFKITCGSLLSLDLFHYTFSIANILWGISLKKSKIK